MLNRCGCEKGEYIWLAPNQNSEEAAQPRPRIPPTSAGQTGVAIRARDENIPLPRP